MQITRLRSSVARRGATFLLPALLISYVAPAAAAPPALRRVHVLQLASARPADAGEAIRLTHALKLNVTRASNVRFLNTNKKLLRLLDDAKCGRSFADRALYESPPLDAHADQLLDVACLQKMAELADTPPAERYLWGWLYDAGDGKLNVSVHLWQKDLPDRSVSLPYDPATVEQTARRAVLKLLDSERVGDVTLTAPERIQNGSLYVDDAFYGPWDSAHPDTTVATGNHSFEVRTARGAWRVNAVVVAGQVRPISLTTGALATSTNAPPAVPPKDTSSSNVFPWTLVGVGALGVVGTAVFVPQWLSANSDVNDRCTSNNCRPDAHDARDRRSRNGTLSWVSAGAVAVGVVGGVLLWSRSSKEAKGPTAATVAPTLGGAAASVSGRFYMTMSRRSQQVAGCFAATAITAFACSGGPPINLAGYCQERPTDPACDALSPKPAPTLPCDPATQPDATTGVFVSSAGNDANDGSRERPYATLAVALAVGKPRVYVAPGTYVLDKTLTVTTSVVLDGGWTPGWQRACEAPDKTVLQGNSFEVSPVVQITAGAVTLTHLTVQTADSVPAANADQAGASLIDLWITGGTQITLDQVNLVTGNAGDAGKATDGSAAQGTVACNQQTDCSSSPATDGVAAPAGAAATPGLFSTKGYTPGNGQAATDGKPGQAGQAGIIDGTTDQEATCVRCEGLPENDCGQASKNPPLDDRVKRCGCGGQAGKGGKGGLGGGASVALLITSPSTAVTLQTSTLKTGRGGSGAPGGSGGDGVAGSPDPTEIDSCLLKAKQSAVKCQFINNVCTAVGTTTTTAKGGPGGKGGKGGLGGPGAGGPSIGIVTVGGSSNLTINKDVTIQPGAVGKGTSGAPAGEAAPQKAF